MYCTIEKNDWQRINIWRQESSNYDKCVQVQIKVKIDKSTNHLLTKMLHKNMIRSLGKTVVSISMTAIVIFLFLCSKDSPLSLITQPVSCGLYSLHCKIDLTRTMHCIRNCSNDNVVGSRLVILFKQKSRTAGRTCLSPNE